MNLQDLFEHVPSEIMIDIFSLLPVGSIASCKCVSKSWLALLKSHEFLNSHLLKETPALAFHRFHSGEFKLFEFEDWRNLQHQYTSVVECRFPFYGVVLGSTNGLILLCSLKSDYILYICNPITREYIELPTLQDQGLVNSNTKVVVDAFAFGVSKITGQYKVVLVLHDECTLISESECYVYTIGTGSWRRVAGPDTRLEYGCWRNWAFLNGNLHCLVIDFERFHLHMSICCLDLETELYSTFSFPTKRCRAEYSTLSFLKKICRAELCVFQDYLCLCLSNYDQTDFWLMKEYGVDKSWTKQLSIPLVDTLWFKNNYVCPIIKVFEGGDMLIAWRVYLYFYCNKDNNVQKLRMFESCDDMDMFLFNPSFLSLKNFEMENAKSF